MATSLPLTTTAVVRGGGPPTRAANWISDHKLNPCRLVSGRAPAADGEAVINRGAAKSGQLSLGATTILLTPRPVRVRIVGIATFGSADGFGPSTFTGLTPHAAQTDLTGSSPGQITQVLVRAAPGISAGQLAQRRQARLPPGCRRSPVPSSRRRMTPRSTPAFLASCPPG